MRCSLGPKPLLEKAAEEAGLKVSIEDVLQKYCVNQSRRGFPLQKDNLLSIIKQLIEAEELRNPFPNGTPGKSWYYGFLRRNPHLSQKAAEHHSLARAAVTEGAMRSWFTRVLNYAIEDGALPTLSVAPRVLNGDETPFQICQISGMKNQFLSNFII